MALLFSAVTLTGDDNQVELLVPGIPKESNDLRGWTAYENFIASIDHEQEIRVHVAACLYGEGQPFLARPRKSPISPFGQKRTTVFSVIIAASRSQRFPSSHGHRKCLYGMESFVMNEWERRTGRQNDTSVNTLPVQESRYCKWEMILVR